MSRSIRSSATSMRKARYSSSKVAYWVFSPSGVYRFLQRYSMLTSIPRSSAVYRNVLLLAKLNRTAFFLNSSSYFCLLFGMISAPLEHILYLTKLYEILAPTLTTASLSLHHCFTRRVWSQFHNCKSPLDSTNNSNIIRQ